MLIRVIFTNYYSFTHYLLLNCTLVYSQIWKFWKSLQSHNPQLSIKTTKKIDTFMVRFVSFYHHLTSDLFLP